MIIRLLNNTLKMYVLYSSSNIKCDKHRVHFCTQFQSFHSTKNVHMYIAMDLQVVLKDQMLQC